MEWKVFKYYESYKLNMPHNAVVLRLFYTLTSRLSASWILLSLIISLSCSLCCSDRPGYGNRDREGLGPVAAQPLRRVHCRPGFQGAPPGGHHSAGSVSQWLLARAAQQRDSQTFPAGPGGNWHCSIVTAAVRSAISPVEIFPLFFFFFYNLGDLKTLVAHSSQEAVVTARFSAISTGTLVNGVWYKPVEQFILPKVSFLVAFLFSRC